MSVALSSSSEFTVEVESRSVSSMSDGGVDDDSRDTGLVGGGCR